MLLIKRLQKPNQTRDVWPEGESTISRHNAPMPVQHSIDNNSIDRLRKLQVQLPDALCTSC